MNKFHTTADSDDIQLKGLRTQVNETVRTGGIKRESFLGQLPTVHPLTLRRGQPVSNWGKILFPYSDFQFPREILTPSVQA